MTTTIPQIERVIYTAQARTWDSPSGSCSRTSDGRLDVELSPPGSPGHGTNPTQLFAAGWSACMLSAMKQAAAKSKIDVPPGAAVTTEVDAGIADGGVVFQARMNFQLPSMPLDVAEKLVQEAERDCPYSKAVRGNIHTVVTCNDPR